MADAQTPESLIPAHVHERRASADPEALPAEFVLRRHEGATWRGWALGLFCTALLALTIPYCDLVLHGTTFSNHMFPATSVFFLFVLVAAGTYALGRFRGRLGLTRQDLVLVFAMTMVTNALPGNGFWTYWVAQMSGGFFHQSAENRFGELVLPHMPQAWSPHDSEASRPLEWFYTGLPEGQALPWGAWAGPYAIWCGALLMVFGAIFALCGLLRRQWSEHEQLAFPLAQLPEDMLKGLDGSGEQKPFFKDRAALWGIALVFAFHSWNHLNDYWSSIPRIPQGNSMRGYLSEAPWSGLVPFYVFVYPSVIGLTYLISLEVSFSLWVFFVISRVLAMFLIQAGMLSPARSYWEGPFVDLGTGALLALAFGCFFMARKELTRSFLEAVGLRANEGDPSEPGARFWWLLLGFSVSGSLAWMMLAGISLFYGALLLLILLTVFTGLTRLTCEGGLFFMQMYTIPIEMLGMVQVPAAMGMSQVVKLTAWDRVMIGDWFRVPVMPNVMTTMHLSSRTGLRQRTLLSGLAAAIVVALSVSFFSFLYTACHTPGGAMAMSPLYADFPRHEYAKMARAAAQIEAFEAREAEAAAKGGALAPGELPPAARRDWTQIGWIGMGGVLLASSLVVRRFFFWFPHPIGFVMWMGPYPLVCLWFSFFLGWLIKLLIVKFGGAQAYLGTKRFFIGLVVGEACASVVWKMIAALAGNADTTSFLPG
ncbi:MAG: hypothetical protein KIS92_06365 [Planctomycetota bacterium]|nr:hypothetical protein [Planctomycetota bacterium]